MESVRIQFSSSYCKIITAIDPSIEEDLYNTLSFHPNGYYFSPKYQSYVQAKSANLAAIQKGIDPPFNLASFKLWDGFIRLYQPGTHRFKAGLLSRVTEIFNLKYGMEVVVEGFPESKEFIQHLDTYELRPYQNNILPIVTSKRFGIVKSPPRSGKTIIAAATIDSEQEFPVIFFCRSLDLVSQTLAVFQKLLPYEIGVVADGEVNIKPVTIMTIQSVYSAFSKKFPEKDIVTEKSIADKLAVKLHIVKAKIIFYDEAHHSKGDTSKFILSKCTSATMKIGLTATPRDDRENELILESVMGPIIAEVGYSELIREGFLLKPYIYMYKLPPSEVKADTYRAEYRQEVIENTFLKGLLKKLTDALVEGDNTVVIQTEYVEHTKALAKFLGYPFLTGREKKEVRGKVIQQLRDREIKCLVSTLFEEGLDIPSLEYTINLAGGLSNISTFQRMRSITTADGKETCGIIDFFYKSPYLRRHSLARRRQYKSEPEFVYIERDVSKKTLEEIV